MKCAAGKSTISEHAMDVGEHWGRGTEQRGRGMVSVCIMRIHVMKEHSVYNSSPCFSGRKVPSTVQVQGSQWKWNVNS